MGVKDLAAVILKHAPNAATPHTSLAAFRGKTLALDANLLTIKFHHRKPKPTWSSSPAPHPATPSAPGAGPGSDDPPPPPFPSEHDRHRHVKSWYKFITELQALGIKPIVVFDGSTRVPEKARENERRRAGRELQVKRGRAEGVRSARLREVKEVWDGVEVGERWAVAREFVRLVGEGKDGERARGDQVDATEAPVSATTPIVPDPEPPIPTPPETAPPSTPSERLAQLYLAFQHDTSNPIYSKNQLVISDSESQFFADLFHIGLFKHRQEYDIVSPPTAPSQDALATPSTVPPSTSPATPPAAPPEPPAVPAAEQLEAPAVAEVLEAVTEEAVEAEVERLPPVLDVSHEDAEEMDFGLAEILKESERLGASHIARGEGVPKRAFAESLELIQALGIPYLLPPPSSPTEAESLCSTLCALGLADFVVSEDTDVTVYGASLLRQVGTSQYVTRTKRGERQKGMNVLDPVKVRKGLGMTRAMFVDFCLLCGTDFTERLKGLGPMTALKLVRLYTSIEAILANHPPALTALAEMGTSPSAYLQTVHAARALFLTPAPLPAGLPDGWNAARPPSDELEDLMARWGIEGGDGKPRRRRAVRGMGTESAGWAGDDDVLEVEHGRAGAWEAGEEELGPPPQEAWDELDRLAEMAARL